MKILVLNAGSSSQKSCLYELSTQSLPQQSPEPLWQAHIDWTVAQGEGVLQVAAQGKQQKIKLESPSHHQAISRMLETLVTGETQVIETLAEIDLVGHRVVHGGSKYSQPVIVTSEVKKEIRRLIPLAPAHNPTNLVGIESIEQFLGNITQIAVFDTAFHSTMPLAAQVYPIPYHWFEQGIRRYGFHGISHQYCAHRTARILGKSLASLRLITCHLGNGCSLAAIKDGISIDTTMGFTPLEGLMMGNRSGSIDPGILVYLLREHNFSAQQLDTMLNQASGIQGITGQSGDMRHLISAVDKGDKQAQLALDMYIHRLKAGIGSMLASLGGLDALVFTAGVGENSAVVREKTCQGFEFLGLKLDLQKNQASPVDKDIALPDSAVGVLVVKTQEDWAIACQCWQAVR